MTAVNSYQAIDWNNVSTFGQMIHNANAAGAGWLFTAIDILVWFVLFITLSSNFGWKVSILPATFIALVLSLLFAYIGVVSWVVVGIFVGITIAMIMYISWSDKYA